jgi:cytochrome P450
VLFSPLRRVPGPTFAKVTSRWLMLIDLSGYRTLTLHKLHQRYGSAVRVGPNEVSFSNNESIKEVYGQQTSFIKAPIYETMSQPPLGIFSLRDRSLHSQRRRLLSHAFAQSNLFETEPLILQHVQRLLNRVQDNLSKPLDMLALFRLTAFDIVGTNSQSARGTKD